MKTRAQFVAQFPVEVNVEKIQAQGILQKDQDFAGVEVYRALNLLLIKVDGKYYTHD